MPVTAAARSSPSTDLDSALLAIEEIVEQGEGTHTSAFAPVGFDRTTRLPHLKLEPFGFEGAPEPAHYWRFLDIVEGRTPLGDVHPMRLDPSSGDLPDGELHDLSRLFDACYSLQLDVMERVWGAGDESPLIDTAMVPLMNHAQKPIALALLREAWPDGSGEVAGPPFAWDPMPMGDMRRRHGVWATGSTGSDGRDPRPGRRRPAGRMTQWVQRNFRRRCMPSSGERLGPPLSPHHPQ